MRSCHYWIGYLTNNLPSQCLECQDWVGPQRVMAALFKRV